MTVYKAPRRALHHLYDVVMLCFNDNSSKTQFITSKFVDITLMRFCSNEYLLTKVGFAERDNFIIVVINSCHNTNSEISVLLGQINAHLKPVLMSLVPADTDISERVIKL